MRASIHALLQTTTLEIERLRASPGSTLKIRLIARRCMMPSNSFIRTHGSFTIRIATAYTALQPINIS